MPSRAQTIKDFAHDYFLRVNYVDIYGRKVGYDYNHILAEIKAKFPTARTSKRWLRKMAYELSGSGKMPMRRRSGLAEGYAMSLLLVIEKGRALNFNSIQCRVFRKFGVKPMTHELTRLERRLRFLKFTVPPRP
jgi:hypothetical protein